MTTICSRPDGASVVVLVQGRFDFASHTDFRACVKAAVENPAVRRLIVDLSGADYMDSAALGMLLLTRENAVREGKQVGLRNPTPAVRQVLDIAHFEKLFEIG